MCLNWENRVYLDYMDLWQVIINSSELALQD